jgi:hypothetical protein
MTFLVGGLAIFLHGLGLAREGLQIRRARSGEGMSPEAWPLLGARLKTAGTSGRSGGA